MFTLIETAKQNGLIPFKYLTALFEKVPFASSPEDWEKLLPWNVFTLKRLGLAMLYPFRFIINR
jgi:hypothetical protein